MNFLITGITGFAGAHLSQLLFNERHKVFGLSRRSNGMETDILDTVSQDCFDNIEFLYGDLNDCRALDKIFQDNHFDGCFHLAAQSNPPVSFTNPIDTFRTNIIGSANIIDAIARNQNYCVFHFCSTSEVYGNSGSSGKALLETDPLAPCNPYAVSKAAMDLYVQERINNGKIKGFITRAFSHTGIRRGKNFSISADAYQIAKMMLGQAEKKLLVGNLETVRCVVDVKDVVRAYYLLMIRKQGEDVIYNICGATPRKMAFFTDTLIKLSGLKNVEKEISDKFYRKIDIAYQAGNSERLKTATGWEEKIPIEKTLDDLLQYWIKKISNNGDCK